MKLLSICVPTYNRSEEIKALNDSFLVKVLDIYGEDVEVRVCDNSDDVIAEFNRANLDERIKYSKNDGNIGFAGNVLRCASLAEGEYLWLLPDNDDVLWDGFESMMDTLQQRSSDCFLVPYVMKNHFGNTIEFNYDFLESGRNYTAFDVLSSNPGFLPFVLLSSGIVRLDKSCIGEIRDKLSGNIFVQIALLLSMLQDMAAIQVLQRPVIDYKVEIRGRFAPVSLFDSIIELLDYLSTKYESVRSNRVERANRAYRSLLFLLLSHYSGLCFVMGVDGARKVFLTRLISYLDIKNILMALVIMLPRLISGQLYIILLAKDYANKESTSGFGGWIKKFLEGFSILQGRQLSASEQ